MSLKSLISETITSLDDVFFVTNKGSLSSEDRAAVVQLKRWVDNALKINECKQMMTKH